MTAESDFSIVAAIDLGTTFSGFAFSFRNEYVTNPLSILAHSWTAESGALISEKCSTCVLFDPDQNLHSFGFKAEDIYEDLVINKHHKNWYLFRRFKMVLYEAMTLEKEFLIYDISGKAMPALKVFSASIKFLRDEILKACEDRVVGVMESEIKWVITVPAIWTDASKHFMKEAAKLAGIDEKKLVLALEPEAASLYCKHIPVENRGGVGYEAFQTGSKYMVVDAGGGTVDITVHEVLDDNKVKEIYKANGGNWGGTTVDKGFCDMLSDIVGKNCFETFANTESYDYLEMMRDFEVKKRSEKLTSKNGLLIRIPTTLNDICQQENAGCSINDMLQISVFKDKCEIFKDKMKLSSECILNLFTGPVNQITEHIQSLLMKPSVEDITTVLMVGGFSDCDILKAKMREKFAYLNIVIPKDAVLAVLTGAVMFGHDPSSILVRKCRYTYGIDVSKLFEHGKHHETKKFIGTIDNDVRCKDLFDKHVEIDQSVTVGKSLNSTSYFPVHKGQNKMTFKIYASTEKNPMYVTDKSCVKLGQLVADLSELPETNKNVSAMMTFGKTELEVKAISDATGEEVKAYFTCFQ